MYSYRIRIRSRIRIRTLWKVGSGSGIGSEINHSGSTTLKKNSALKGKNKDLAFGAPECNWLRTCPPPPYRPPTKKPYNREGIVFLQKCIWISLKGWAHSKRWGGGEGEGGSCSHRSELPVFSKLPHFRTLAVLGIQIRSNPKLLTGFV